MTPEQLKASILQYAIQGKLVEQRPEEGTGEKLYRQIQDEKKRLIKEGKIKKEKPLPEITEDEIPFDIPESWKWVRIAQIVMLNPKNDLADDLETSFVPMSCVTDGFRNHHTFEIKTWKEIKKGFSHFAEGDIGVAKITPCFQNRKSVIFKNLKNGYGAGTTELTVVRTIGHMVLPEFLLWFFKTAYFIGNGVKSFTGTAGQQRIHKDYLATCLIPLPPLTEQKRIVVKIEELLSHADRYDAAYEKLEQFNAKFPEDMKKSVLQYAIQGKLVEQRPEEGTGEELYRQIQEEKKRLIKEGKIKKEKPLPEIREDDIPFSIPESWKWVRLPEIGRSSLGKTLNKELDAGNEVHYLCSINVYWDGVKLSQVKTAKFSEADTEKYLLCKGDLLICEGGDVGRSAVWDKDIEMYYQNALHCVRFFGEINPYYFKYCLELYKCNRILENASKGMTIKHLVQNSLYAIQFPLPPLAEQQRIVAKLEKVLPLCERLK